MADWVGKCIGTGDAADVATIAGLECMFQNLLSVVLRLVGIAAFVMIIVGGFKLLTAGSDAKAAESGKATITSGVIGVVLALVAWFILVAIHNFTGANILEFNVGE